MIAYSWRRVTAVPAEPPRRKRFYERHLMGFSLFLMVASLIAVVLYPRMVITIPAGQVGVLWKRFNGIGIYCWCFVGRGTVLNPREVREEGLHIIWPWDLLFPYDLRLQTQTDTYNAISKDGVSLTATINVRFQLNHDTIGAFHKFIGPAYGASVIRPEIGSRAREIISQYTAEQVYSIARQEVQDKIQADVQAKLGERLDALVQPEASEQLDPERYHLKNSLIVLDTLVLGIELPPPVIAAINRKIEQYYVVQEYDFRIQREQKEAIRKGIEAQGIHAFQETVSQGISDSYLRWRGIEATLSLAQSTNSKIVVIGGGKDGLPIILGNVDGTAAAAAAVTSPSDPAAPKAPAEKVTPSAEGTAPGSGASPGTPPGTTTSGATGTTPGAAASGAPGAAAGTGTTPPAAAPGGNPTGTTGAAKPKAEGPATFGLPELKALLTRLIGGDTVESEPAKKSPAAEPSR